MITVTLSIHDTNRLRFRKILLLSVSPLVPPCSPVRGSASLRPPHVRLREVPLAHTACARFASPSVPRNVVKVLSRGLVCFGCLRSSYMTSLDGSIASRQADRLRSRTVRSRLFRGFRCQRHRRHVYALQSGCSRGFSELFLPNHHRAFLQNEAEEQMVGLFEADLSYVDERLSWVPEEFDGVDVILVRRDALWLPDITPFAW